MSTDLITGKEFEEKVTTNIQNDFDRMNESEKDFENWIAQWHTEIDEFEKDYKEIKFKTHKLLVRQL